MPSCPGAERRPDPRPDCRPGCAACCIAPSISTAIPGMPQGKPAGVPCLQLDEQLRCRLFGQPGRPAVCSSLAPSAEMCGADRQHALRWLARLEAETRPASALSPRPG
ncbi:MAG: YkgJ family cysteine cluster protein [Burkholderiaceae bacterium]|nr:YkgJ family cysteine cluster protein [Burkholderiaceae bacterium]